MGRNFASILFTERVKAEQERIGSRASYARVERDGPDDTRLTEREAVFIAARDGFYMASISASGWPYIQHRGGPPGFVRILDAQTIAFADFRGNRQHVSVGNLAGDGRVALFFMDYANARRLKLLGHAQVIDGLDDPGLVEALAVPDYPARAERAIAIRVAGYDWNCPQHITRRFSEAEINALLADTEAPSPASR
jgi:hypothetical protein